MLGRAIHPAHGPSLYKKYKDCKYIYADDGYIYVKRTVRKNRLTMVDGSYEIYADSTQEELLQDAVRTKYKWYYCTNFSGKTAYIKKENGEPTRVERLRWGLLCEVQRMTDLQHQVGETLPRYTTSYGSHKGETIEVCWNEDGPVSTFVRNLPKDMVVNALTSRYLAIGGKVSLYYERVSRIESLLNDIIVTSVLKQDTLRKGKTPTVISINGHRYIYTHEWRGPWKCVYMDTPSTVDLVLTAS